MKRLLKVAASLALVGGIAAPAFGVTALTLENPGLTVYQQTQNSPCIFGDPSCNNPAGFGNVVLPSGGGSTTYDETSVNYTVGQISAVVGSTFFVGIDVNTTTRPLATETLDYFAMLVNGVVQYQYDPASPGTQLFTNNNGNGYSDELLKGFSLAGFTATDTVTFRVIVNNATDGREQFFLINSNAPPTPPVLVPEPSSITMALIAGLGLLLLSRRRLRAA